MIFLSALALTALSQGAPTEEPRLLRFPAIHGSTVVFSYAGDLWVSDVSGGNSRHLTTAPGNEVRPKISADGKWVAYTASYEGSSNVYLISIDGGEPKRLTFDAEPDNVLGWTPDGKIAYATTAGNFINRQARLNIVDPKGGLPVRTKINEISELSYFPSGHKMAYTRVNSYAFNWRRYRGGTQGRISIYDFDSNSYSELPSKREQSYFPMVVGNDIFYISDKSNGTLNLYKYDLGKKSDTKLTSYTDEDIKYPSTDGKSIVFERDGFLFDYDIANNVTKKLSPSILSENLQARPALKSLAQNIENFSLSPSGARLAVVARGEIFSVPAKTGDTRNMTNSSAARESAATWTPDGQSIAYISDKTGETEIYMRPQLGGQEKALTSSKLPITGFNFTPDGKTILFTTVPNVLYSLDVASKTVTKLFQSKYGLAGSDVSPDSQWLAYIDARSNGFGQLFIRNLKTGKTTTIDDGYYSDSDCTFDRTGKFLYLCSARSFAPTYGIYEFSLKVENAQRLYVIPLTKDLGNPLTITDEEEPSAPAASAAGMKMPRGGPGGPPPTDASGIKIDFDGIADRILPLPIGPGTYAGLTGTTGGLFFNAGGALVRFDLNTKQVSPLFNGPIGAYTFNYAGTKIAYYAAGVLGVADVGAPASIGTGRVDTHAIEAVINPREEWRQILIEAWRYERDHFYDETMRNQDWGAIGERYKGYLKYVNSRGDLNYVIGLLLGELGTSHSYVLAPGDLGNVPRPIPVGHLGADYAIDGSHLKFSKIYRGRSFEETTAGPLGEPGVDVKEGDYLLAIDGKTVTSTTNPEELMMDKVGRYVTLTVNSSSSITGARQVRVKPIPTEMQLRYVDFIDNNRKMVDKLSGGRIGYMHLQNTAAEGSADFVRGFYPQTDKDAMIVDERWNGGGYIQPWFVDTLARKVKAYIQSRTTADGPEEAAIDGPKALLINAYAGSGGDFFPWMFRQAKLGPLIGKRTWGGLVGINAGDTFVDGGGISCPEFSIYNPDTNEIIAENQGIDPDIDVDNRPDLVAGGQDPQLEAAIKYLMGKLQGVPTKKSREKLPSVGRNGHITP